MGTEYDRADVPATNQSIDAAVAAGAFAGVHAGLLAQLLSVDAVRVIGGLVGRPTLVGGWAVVIAFGVVSGLGFVLASGYSRSFLSSVEASVRPYVSHDSWPGRFPRPRTDSVTVGIAGGLYGSAIGVTFGVVALAGSAAGLTGSLLVSAVPIVFVGCLAYGFLVGIGYAKIAGGFGHALS